MKLASKFVASYIHGEFGYSAYDILKNDPIILDVGMINYSAGSQIKKVESMKASAGIIHYLLSLEIPLEQNASVEACQSSLVEIILDGSKNMSELIKIVDSNFKFSDE